MKVRLIDAGFVWTEPHSKRIKVKVTIQQEVFAGAILQQAPLPPPLLLLGPPGWGP
jgi:NMD protein affecting ribosome stability and mRNA decay